MAQSRLTSELQCPVCLGLFSDPVTLPCGHNFCRGCLESYLATARETHLCPECRAPIPRRDFRTNWALRNMADRARQEEEERDREPPRCPEHEKKLRLYCETDGTLICSVCRDSRSHRGHGFKPVQEAAQEFRESLLAAQKAVKEDVAARESLRDRQQEHIASRKGKHRSLKTQLSAQFEELRQILMKKEEEEEQYMDEMETLLLRPMERNLEAIERELRDSREKAKAIKTGLDTTEPHHFLEWWRKGGYSTANREKTAFSSDGSGSLRVIPDSLTVSPAESLEKHIDWRALQSSIRRDIEKDILLRMRRIVLIGKTGVGKSAVGNTILGRRAFTSEPSFSSVTSQCLKETGAVNGTPVAVIDTPGIIDTTFSEGEIVKEIVRCVQVSVPGPHAFLLVIQIGRFTAEEKNAVEALQELFGEKVHEYMIVLFTYGDSLQGRDIKEFVDKASPELRSVIEKCGNRYHVFNNRDQSDRTQVRELLDKIDSMVEDNGGAHYTQEMYEEAEKLIRQKEEELRRKYEEERQRREEELKKKLQDELCQEMEETTRRAMREIWRKCSRNLSSS